MMFDVRSLLAMAAIPLVCFDAFAAPRPRSFAAPPAKIVLSQQQLEKYSRQLKEKNAGAAYSRLSSMASLKSAGVLGQRASLALGYYDYQKGNYGSAAKWLARAMGDPLLHDYTLYWSAENSIAMHRDADALADLAQFRKDYPNSVMTDQALESLCEAATAANQPAEAIAALNAYPFTPEKPDLLFLRAEAFEQAGHPLDAASDYLSVYLRFPASERAREAGQKLAFLRGTLGDQLPPIPIEQRVSHAVALFAAKDWTDARGEYSQILPQLSGTERERAELRILECGTGLGDGPADLLALKVTDPNVEAERLYSLADIYRAQKSDADLTSAVESAITIEPSSRWAELALFLAGNYFWVQLDRDHAAAYYKRLAENFPTSPNADPAQWRVAWTEVLKRQPDAAELLADHLRRFPGSGFTADALYWLGELAEEANDAPLARAYYEKLEERFPQNYFTMQAANRLHFLGNGPAADAEVLSMIPPAPPALKMSDTIPPAAAERQARADALRSIAFDSSAELELRAAYAATGEPRLLFESAQAAAQAGHYGAAIVTIRQIFPQLESRPFDEVPLEIWRTSYSLPYETSIRHWSARAGVDPMLVAGLIRQESAFDPEAHSNRDAYGLMQLLPKTGRLMARLAHVRYSRLRLYDPDYNIRLGTLYFAQLRQSFGSVEAALAAYNAGEDRVTFWTSGQTYRSLPEFTDSIPFTETRDYVEIITRNAAIYRMLYGDSDEPRKPAARRKR
jgi:soluble lytic murein transglycosylase